METVENILWGIKIPSPYYDFFKIIQFGIRSLLLSRMKSNAINLNN